MRSAAVLSRDGAHRAAVSLGGDPARGLQQLIARLSLEPGVRDLHWHLDDTSLDAERETVAA
ncbi:hypothetical protein AB5J52_40670 [Streptomyces sp. R39]|uniref:Uncharacterized protein n=1 Tax=Streptomyces sp. R39 TaxID=3238631 RepID=A0AB39R4W1_9ACTN